MDSSLRAGQWVVVALAAVIGGLVCAVVGLGIGANYGGNYCNTCAFNGQRGYETTGQIGLLVGAAVGLCLSALGLYAVFRQRNAKRSLETNVR